MAAFLRRVQCVATAGILLVGCSPAPVATQTPSASNLGAPTDLPCSATGVDRQEDVTELRRSVETGPLFLALSMKAPATSCAATAQSGRLGLEYQFRDGGSLRVTRDPRIEYTEHVGRFASPPSENSIDVLTRTERAVFSPNGCGIDWKKSEVQPAGDDPKAIENVYRGDTCNCQARVRNDAAGRVAGLTFRSAC